MRMSLRSNFGRVVAGTGLALVATMFTATAAFACIPADDRAVGFDGNAVTCDAPGVGGGLPAAWWEDGNKGTGPITFSGGVPGTDQYLTITDVPDSRLVSAIVVKGGPAYNVYKPGEKGLPAAVPWSKLHAPLNPGGNIPTISHWLVCIKGGAQGTSSVAAPPPVVTTTSTKTTVPPTSVTTTSKPVTTTTAPSASTSAAAVPVTTTTTPAAAPALAKTGFGNGWLLGLGAALLLAGVGFMALPRTRLALQRRRG